MVGGTVALSGLLPMHFLIVFKHKHSWRMRSPKQLRCSCYLSRWLYICAYLITVHGVWTYPDEPDRVNFQKNRGSFLCIMNWTNGDNLSSASTNKLNKGEQSIENKFCWDSERRKVWANVSLATGPNFETVAMGKKSYICMYAAAAVPACWFVTLPWTWNIKKGSEMVYLELKSI